ILGARILFVDDEPEIRSLGEQFLRAEGFTRIDLAKDGQEAINLFTKTKHDVVIADILMPKKNGIEVLGYVKILSPHSQVIIITGHADKDAAIAAMKLGAYHFVEKPIEFDALIKVIRQSIELKLLFDQKT
ncbi:MAG: response regulator, partial [Candidatus Dadabacteria bacterium]|nr:response regulator [Candidatus Dadabacteria bacterium]